MNQHRSDLVRGTLSVLLLLALLVGVPLALVTQVGSPLPASIPSWTEIQTTLTTGNLDSWSLVKGLALVAWLVWGQLAVSVAAEIAALMRGRSARRVPGPEALRSAVANLVASAAVVVSSLGRLAEPALAAAPPPVATAMPSTLPADDLVAQLAGGTRTAIQPTPHHLPSVGQDPRDDPQLSGPAAETGDAPVWRVKSRDTLWDIAETTLGDGLRWREIQRLNAGRRQPDGAMLSTGDDHIRPGWQLLLPEGARLPLLDDDSDAVQPLQSDEETITVESGDTLWDLSEEHLDDPHRWPELFEENRGDPQPDGRALTDPDLIHPGWHLDLPTAPSNGHATAPPQVVAPTDVPHSDTEVEAPATHSASPRVADVPRGDLESSSDTRPPVTQQRPNPAPDQLHDSWIDEAALIAGIGLAAAGIAATLDRIRQRQRRRRRPGERIRLTDGVLADTETRVRGLADAVTADFVDVSLRALPDALVSADLPVPAITLVSVSATDLAVHLADAHDAPPPPWESHDEGHTWVLPRATDPTPLRALAGHALSPAPLLVSLGTTADEQRRVLLNLGHAGLLSIDSNDESARALLLQQSVELATTSRASYVDVFVVGFGGLLSTFERVTFLDRADDAIEALERAARLSGDGGTEDPHNAVALFLDPLDDDDAIRLAEIVNRSPCVAAVLVGADGAAARLSATPDGYHLAPWDVDVRPLELTATELERIAEITIEAKRPAAMPEDDATHTSSVAPVSGNGQVVFDDAAEPPDPTRRHHPEVHILGSVDFTNVEEFGSSKAEELVVYLALHRRGEDFDALLEALWPGEKPNMHRLHTAASRARKALGDDPDGEPYLPHSQQRRYRLSAQVKLDYDHFRALLGQARRDQANAIDPLHAALNLIRGRPLAATGHEYGWATLDVHAIEQDVADAAHWLAELHLANNEPEKASWAAEKGLRADPYFEQLYRDLMRAAALAGNTARVHEIMEHLRRVVGDGSGNDADDRLDGATLRTYEQLTLGSP